MKLRVNISTESAPVSYLVETDNIKSEDLKEALLFTVGSVGKTGHSKSFGRYEVIHGMIIQQGYEMNEELRMASEDETIPEIPVLSDI